MNDTRFEGLEELCEPAPWSIDTARLLERVKKAQMDIDMLPPLLSREYAEILLAIRFYERREDFGKALWKLSVLEKEIKFQVKRSETRDQLANADLQEIARLRAALEEIANGNNAWAHNVASRALEGT